MLVLYMESLQDGGFNSEFVCYALVPTSHDIVCSLTHVELGCSKCSALLRAARNKHELEAVGIDLKKTTLQ